MRLKLVPTGPNTCYLKVPDRKMSLFWFETVARRDNILETAVISYHYIRWREDDQTNSIAFQGEQVSS